MHSGKRLVICLDGTWQNPYKRKQRDDGGRVLKPSNVLKLSRAVLPACPEDGRIQITAYDSGLGALIRYPRRANRLLSMTDRLLGGVWGAGFESNVEEAFRFLVLNHRPGDQVFLFGFSRGAAQVRALARFLGWLGGVPRKADAYFAPLYFLHFVRTRGRGRPEDVVTAEGRRPDYPMTPVDIVLLGVWDTVMALGSRVHAARGTSRRKWSFFVGKTPPPGVRHARQALAIDERRFDFQPEIWRACSADQTLEQRWFAGSHSNVGGGYVMDGLANIPFRWLVREASRLGLGLDADFLKHYRPYPQARLYPSDSPATKTAEWARFRFSGGRRSLIGHPPEAGMTLDPSVIHRLCADPTRHPQLVQYRPRNLIAHLARQPDLDGYLRDIGFLRNGEPAPEVLRDLQPSS